jgi:acyl dehydratase
MNALLKEFEDIAVGDTAAFEHAVTQKDVLQFAQLSGDYNPLHMDEGYAARTEFNGTIVHGLFLGSLVSRLVGMELPGQKALLLEESLAFKKPARIDDALTVWGSVAHKSESTRILEIAVRVSRKDELLVQGIVRVRVLP